MTPEERQGAFALALALVAVTGTFLAYVAFQDGYAHARPAEDCSINYDYPMCARAGEPAVAGPPDLIAQYLALVTTGVLVVAFLALSLKSAVRSQRALIVTGPVADATPRQAILTMRGDDGFRIPPAIPNNAIPPELVKPPKTKPKKGPDVKGLEVRDG